MVANKKKTKEDTCRAKRGRHCQWDTSAMTAALEAVRTHQMSQRAACKAYGIPRCTLQMRLSGKVDVDTRPGRPSIMAPKHEEKLADFACNRASMGIGFGRKEFLKHAGNFARKYNIRFKHASPTLKWWRGFKRRNLGVRLRQPEGTAAVRHQCMDKQKVGKYFHVLKGVLDENNLHVKPHCIWNMDESGVQLDHKPGKVLAAKGAKYLHSRTSGNRETITVIAAVNAAGDRIAPHLIVKGKTKRSLNSFQTDHAPEGTTWSWSDSGWTKQGIALLWFTKSFLPSIGKDRPQVLILDGHDSHNFIELIDTAIENNIHIIELPAHTSNWLQPCDRTVFGPFKNAYRKACDELMINYPGSLVSRGTFCGILNKAWSEAVTSANIQSGFRACGIHPFHPDAIPAEAYTPNSLYASTPSTSSATQSTFSATPLQSSEQPGTDNGPAATPLQPPEQSGTESRPTFDNEEECREQVASADVLNLSDYIPDGPEAVAVSLTVTPPEIALDLIESSLSSAQLECYKFCLSRNYDLDKDDTFITWKQLKLLCENAIAAAGESGAVTSGSEPNTADQSLNIENIEGDDGVDVLSSTGLDVSVSELFYNCAEMEKTSGSSEPEHQLLNEQQQMTETKSAPSLKEVNGEPSSSLFRNRSSPGDDDNDVLPYPSPVVRNRKNSGKQKFFLLTSSEAREAKQKELEEKLSKAEKKKEREVARAKKREEKLKRQNGETSAEHEKRSEKCSKKVSNDANDENRPKQRHTSRRQRPKRKDNRQSGLPRKRTRTSLKTLAEDKDLTPCASCSIRHCDSSDQSWIQCQQCDAWYHNACQGLDEQGPDKFACISCEDSADY